jgi:hypothetical protein
MKRPFTADDQCPRCFLRYTCVGLEKDLPEPSDQAICVKCGHIDAFSDFLAEGAVTDKSF